MKLLSIVSARPNFIKLAAIHHAFMKDQKEDTHVIVHTGQHHDPLFSDVFFQELEIPLPTINLGIHGGTNEEQQDRVQEKLRTVLMEEKPDFVLVYGDVNGAAAAAEVASSLQIRVAHVEAGLRSGDLSMQEELNRIRIDGLASELFVSEQSGMEHLKQESPSGHAHFVGNTMIDTLIRMLPKISILPLPENTPEKFGVVTLHRPSNVDDPVTLAHLVGILSIIGKEIPLLFPVHLRTKARLEEAGLFDQLSEAVTCIDPLPYLPFLRLVQRSHFVLTDSGGIQEETTYLQKKCFTARANTERPVTCSLGFNELVDLHDPSALERILAFAKLDSQTVGTIPPLWDGRAGERILSILRTSNPIL